MTRQAIPVRQRSEAAEQDHILHTISVQERREQLLTLRKLAYESGLSPWARFVRSIRSICNI